MNKKRNIICLLFLTCLNIVITNSIQLDLSHNQLNSLEILTDHENQITTSLKLNNNELTRLNKNDFFGFTQLTDLTLSFNQIEHLEFDCFNTLNLKIIINSEGSIN